eukprot:TRINITY_DN11073_c0_g1_i6.p1 TRINITY_DN11073_c0_g1~~TRINITY_DN11073_c0_g1_i6.p1  ORF type:complete len:240 (-),score=37.98 TRINITY_DN11073_c0_g1_i6:227-946(-)
MDQNDSGSLTMEEVLNGFDTHVGFRKIMDLMDVQRSDLPAIFHILDKDKSGDVTPQEFVEQVHQLKCLDIHTLSIFIRHKVECIDEFMQKSAEEFRRNVQQIAAMIPLNEGNPLRSAGGSVGEALSPFCSVDPPATQDASTEREMASLNGYLEKKDCPALTTPPLVHSENLPGLATPPHVTSEDTWKLRLEGDDLPAHPPGAYSVAEVSGGLGPAAALSKWARGCETSLLERTRPSCRT